ncbi:AAA family ATPase [Sanguibacter antarcticus]|uniref:MinD-like ATPase involved in chromosome partitioning or flagellar assembly n=1 Tax=Sanguibacter antarcticus TaxID=372484 RepID=A0A2A9E2Z7_9MICO|nr:hypothetical protein [Sanguibacter antarcticus]PFG32579.1 MinD-like ATPase involved in chromosome partitioning or flagellar assembly [Sanguibacter antarcticus]
MSPGAFDQPESPARRESTVLCSVRGALEGHVVGILATAADLNVTRRCADVAELLAASASGLGMVAVVSGDLVGLDRAVVAALHTDGVRVIGILDTTDDSQAERMAALGVDAVLDAGLVAETLVSSVRALASTTVRHEEPSPSFDRRGTADGWGSERADDAWGRPSPHQDDDAQATDPRPGRRGRIVAVWGPTGAPGRSTIAFNIASELVTTAKSRRSAKGGRARAAAEGEDVGASGRETSLLVDADTYSGSLAQIAGLLDESSGIAAACRAVGQGALDPALLARLSPEISPRLRVLTGIARASRWPEVSEVALDVVWEGCREIADWTVVDCGFSVERDEMLSYDTRAPQRNGATLSALGAADVVVVVGGADPVGVQRLVRALDDLRESGAADTAERIVVVNRVRASAAGANPSSALRDALYRYASVNDAVLVPDDQPACDGALLAGRTLAEHAPASAPRRAIRSLADRVRATAAPSDGATPEKQGATSPAGRPVAH